jgi:hypothetical protein
MEGIRISSGTLQKQKMPGFLPNSNQSEAPG